MSEPTLEDLPVKNEPVEDLPADDLLTEDLPVKDEPATPHVQVGPVEANKNGDPSDELDVYSYTQREEFTSEIFKIEIKNLPRYVTPTELKKLFRKKFSLETKKIKVMKGVGHKPSFAFVTFCNDEDRNSAIDQANNYLLKKHTLQVSKAKPAKDPALEKKSQRDANDEPAM